MRCNISTFALWSVAAALVIGAYRLLMPLHGNRLASASALRMPLSAPTPDLRSAGVATLNLACAEGLPGAETLNIPACLDTLEQWGARVRDETQRHYYRFRDTPSDYYHSEAYFRMLMMAVVLYEDCGVRYNPALISSPDAPGSMAFFSDSRDLFLHGVLAGRPAVNGTVARLGTCSSLPVLYAAVGRRLGYPLKLATAKAHVFLRWESATERFNLEATGKGMNRYDDDHYKQWPFPVSEAELREDGYLKSLTDAEEIALFMSLRAQCLRVAGRQAESVQALEMAAQLAPESRPYRLLLAAARADAPPAAMQGAALLPPEYDFAPPSRQPALGPDPNPRRDLR